VRSVPGLEGRIISGMQPGLLAEVLADPVTPGGTTIVSHQLTAALQSF
jgi:hypothetical protein